MDIKPIETRYKGYRFRSRLEARYAVFFDAMSIEWEYEKEGYDFGEAGWYLPDFWLPQINAWVEIKGAKALDSEVAKCVALKKQVGGWGAADSILLGGTAAQRAMGMFCNWAINTFGKTHEQAIAEMRNHLISTPKVILFDGGIPSATRDGESCWIFIGDNADEVLQAEISSFDVLWVFLLGKPRKLFAYACDAARSARFEHGENGAK